MTNWSNCAAVECDPRRTSGDWAFKGTRVPVYALFENIASGATVREFLEWYPEVKVCQAAAVLKHETESLKIDQLQRGRNSTCSTLRKPT